MPSASRGAVIALPFRWSAPHILLMIAGVLLMAAAIHFVLGRLRLWRDRAVLEERQRLALEMHDTLAQSFAGIGFQLQAMRDELRLSESLRIQADTALEMVRRGHEEAKRSIAALRPGLSGSSGMADALRREAERLSNGGALAIRASIDGQARHLPLNVADTFFRIGQEAISNSIRHAGATRMDISLHFGKDDVALLVKDDGSGFELNAQHQGFGICGMAKRADRIGALFALSSGAGKGTTVTVTAHLSSRPTLPEHARRAVKYLLRTGIHTS
ncbi:sensor histidine kinase [Paracidobacterium acidisoli]|nr:histidine kinase [Paracidobacterium acidisoli]MBT9330097.1 hypothetical protein [Paracidobacterium acidisoli]